MDSSVKISSTNNQQFLRNVCLLGHIYDRNYKLIPLLSGNIYDGLVENEFDRYKIEKIFIQNYKLPMDICNIIIDDYLARKTPNLTQFITINNFKNYIFNIIDLPGFKDNFGNMMNLPMLTLADGCILIINAINDVNNPQTQQSIKQIIFNKITTILFIDNINECLFINDNKSKMNKNHLQICFDHFFDIFENVSNLLSSNIIIDNIDEKVNSKWFTKEMICFGNVSQGWGFTLKQFANIYTNKFGISQSNIIEKLFSKNAFWDSQSKKWIKKQKNSLISGFVEFILLPIFTLYQTIICNNNDNNEYKTIIEILNINIDWNCNIIINGTSQMKANYIFRQWLPLRNILLNSIIEFIPSPVSSINKDNILLKTKESAMLSLTNGINKCIASSNAPTVVLISHIIPMDLLNVCKKPLTSALFNCVDKLTSIKL